MVIAQSIKGCELFQGFSDRHLQRIESISRQLTFEQGAFLFRENEPAAYMFVIASGTVALEMGVGRMSFQRSVAVASLGPPEVIGLRSLVPPFRSGFSARAVTKVDCVRVDASALRERMTSDMSLDVTFAKTLVQVLSRRLDQAREVLAYERSISTRT